MGVGLRRLRLQDTQADAACLASFKSLSHALLGGHGVRPVENLGDQMHRDCLHSTELSRIQLACCLFGPGWWP